MPGYDRSRIVGVSEGILEEFICGICVGVFIKPTVTQCCGQTYCFDCINKRVEQFNTCPNDREVLTTDQLKPSPKMVTNLLNKLIIKCDFHKKGCKAVVKINDLVKHKENVCVFNPSRYCDNCGDIKLNHSDKECIKKLVTKLDCIQKENHNLREEKEMDHINYEKLKVDFERSERMNDVLKKRVDHLQKESAAQESNVERSGAPSVETRSGTEENPLEFLRAEPQFPLMRTVSQEHPHLLNDMIQQIGQNNPQLFALIFQNREAFVRMLNEPIPSGGQTPTAGAQPATTGQPFSKSKYIMTKEGKNDKPSVRTPAYAYFFRSCRKEHMKKHPNENVMFSEFSKKCAQQWSAMSDKEKNRFNLLAEKAGPKRPLTAFLWYCNDERPRIRDTMDEPTVGEVAKEVCRRWNKFTEAQKRKYVTLAEGDKARYENQMKAYKAKEGKSAPVPKKEESDDSEKEEEENKDEED